MDSQRREPVVPRGSAQDLRVSAVLEVLRGESNSRVAARWGVESGLLHRWVRDFVAAGTAQVTHRPADDVAMQRDRFLVAFAHGLRTPLAVSQGWVAMLADGDLEWEDAGEVLGRVETSLDVIAERLREAELLANSCLGRLRLDRRTIAVSDLLDTLPETWPHQAPRDTASVCVDTDLIERVLRDLWDAAGALPEPALRRIEVCHQAPWVEFRVVRVGEPIEPSVLQALFEPFAVNDDTTGVTLGLYLARALAVAHGGTIGVEQDDHSAVFWVRVPEDRSQSSTTAPTEHLTVIPVPFPHAQPHKENDR